MLGKGRPETQAHHQGLRTEVEEINTHESIRIGRGSRDDPVQYPA